MTSFFWGFIPDPAARVFTIITAAGVISGGFEQTMPTAFTVVK